MFSSGIARFGIIAALVLPLLAGCKAKDGDKPEASATAAPAPPPPPPVAPTAPAPAPVDPNTPLEACKKTFATSCATPCEQKVQSTIKDLVRQRAAANQCMVACLEQADKACNKH